MRKMTKYTIFFSWQSDEKKGNGILKSILSGLPDTFRDKYHIDLTIDHSTLGESGMPYIEQTILRKIDSCDILIADVTPILCYEKQAGNGQKIKKMVPNPNVLLELGYAMSAVGLNYIIPVGHQGKWSPADMPFDINHHHIYTFNSKSCDLEQEVLKIIQYINKHGRHRKIEEPYLFYAIRSWWIGMRDFYIEKQNLKRKNVICMSSTNFFSLRMASAFPGQRGLAEYTGWWNIYRCLSRLFELPIKFQKSIGESTTDPIWFYRGGNALYIDNFRWLGGRRFLIGNDELKIKRIASYNNHSKYYSQYLYIEAEPDYFGEDHPGVSVITTHFC